MGAPKDPIKYCKDFIIKTRVTKKKLVIINSQNIWNRDILVNNKLKQLGYHLIRIWVSDINKNPQKEVLGILQLIKKESV